METTTWEPQHCFLLGTMRWKRDNMTALHKATWLVCYSLKLLHCLFVSRGHFSKTETLTISVFVWFVRIGEFNKMKFKTFVNVLLNYRCVFPKKH